MEGKERKRECVYREFGKEGSDLLRVVMKALESEILQTRTVL